MLNNTRDTKQYLINFIFIFKQTVSYIKYYSDD